MSPAPTIPTQTRFISLHRLDNHVFENADLLHFEAIIFDLICHNIFVYGKFGMATYSYRDYPVSAEAPSYRKGSCHTTESRHSHVSARHGLVGAIAPRRILQKRLNRKTTWTAAVKKAVHVINRCTDSSGERNSKAVKSA